ncbi:hypothetical protein R3P38DRAFT_2543209 [Favolaschia claudopus]|uniref:Uncharacterized protein n=1 Tax=Favolaschia claudopus TaxID=2862362 RepID=A0AAW0AV16_9AGAR
MCDECTVSKLSAMSTAKRNYLSAENLVRCAQLNQYWRYGYGRQDVRNHTQVRLELPVSNRKPTNPKRARIPTLADLLNTGPPPDASEPIDLETVFNLRAADPAEVEEMADGEDDEDFAAPVLVERTANVPTLDIETYIGINAPKLLKRFAPKQMDIREALSPQKEKRKAAWKPENSTWEAHRW